ncbi:MAG: TolC family protein [Polaromonas sp.]|uniref:TolC family protein n=1 Tax=Polaromonas sp. TaxID=1869339 RepID=UPI002733289C|nr:TolC family protein [Polaromonas sp.]MDP2818907.1 TolC family protein [Polaromonas sp.]
MLDLSSFRLSRLACASFLLPAALTLASAQTAPPPSSSPSLAEAPPPTGGTNLREALDAAWALSPAARSADNRRAQLQARERAASSWINGSPSALLAQRSDRFNNNGGFREYEAELELPIWSPGVRGATQRELAAQRLAFEPQLLIARLRVAAEVRELAASLAVARTERELAARKHSEALALAQDVERRVKAGDSARVDGLQAQSLVQQAATGREQTAVALTRQLNQWLTLTGLANAPALEEVLPPVHTSVQPEHPALQAAQTRVQAAQATLELSQTDRGDPMAIGVGVTRERATFSAAGESNLRLAIKIPFGTDNRNAPRIAAARAELDAAQAELDAVQRQTRDELASALAELDAARRTQASMAERARLSTEVQALVAKAYRLGEADLPTRLRADSEKFEADLSLARARVGLQRAISQLNQALGLLP